MTSSDQRYNRYRGFRMFIWRGLHPAVMAQLIVGLAQARQAARAGAQTGTKTPPADSVPPKT